MVFIIKIFKSAEWEDGIYYGNAQLPINEYSNYYIVRDNAVIATRSYEEGSDYDCSKCFDEYITEHDLDDDEISQLNNSLSHNGQRICGTGISFGCPYANAIDERHGLDYKDVEELLSKVGLLKKA